MRFREMRTENGLALRYNVGGSRGGDVDGQPGSWCEQVGLHWFEGAHTLKSVWWNSVRWQASDTAPAGTGD